MTSFLWDQQQGFLLEGINKKGHIPGRLLSGDAPKDGWWPAIYHREVAFLSLKSIPTEHRYLFQEVVAARTYTTEQIIDARSVFYMGFYHHTLCAFIQYDPKESRFFPMVQITAHEDLFVQLEFFVEEHRPSHTPNHDDQDSHS
jgi:hypothetical protein